CIEVFQELVHGPHDAGMRVEGAARQAHVRRAVLAVALHQVLATANDADRQAATQGLAVGHEVGAYPEIFLCATSGEPEAQEYFTKNQHDAALAADLAQLAKPVGVSCLVKLSSAAAADERRVGGRRLIEIECPDRVDENTGDVAPPAQEA